MERIINKTQEGDYQKMFSKTLMLTPDADAYYFNRISLPNVDVCSVFSDSPDKHGAMLKFFRKIGSSLTHLYYLDWYRHLGEYSKVIITDMALDYDCRLLQNIRRKNKKCKCYIYSWNIVKNENKHNRIMKLAKKTGFKYYCYDKGTCARYGLSFNTIMYDRNLQLPVNKTEYDMFFLGFLKDRKVKMMALYNAMTEGGLKPRFVIVGKKEENLPFDFRDSYVNYFDYLNMLSRSRAILDISQSGQDGYSMRVMEAIFFDRKLITTNRYVLDSEFYDKNNIYVIDLGQINANEIRDFFDLEFHPYPESVKEFYSFESWLNRFN